MTTFNISGQMQTDVTQIFQQEVSPLETMTHINRKNRTAVTSSSAWQIHFSDYLETKKPWQRSALPIYRTMACPISAAESSPGLEKQEISLLTRSLDSL